MVSLSPRTSCSLLKEYGSDFGLRQGIDIEHLSRRNEMQVRSFTCSEVCEASSGYAKATSTVSADSLELLTGEAFQAGSSRLGDAVGGQGHRWRETEALIAQATAQSPDDRFQSITEFGDAFAVTMEAQALILSGRASGGATTVRVALAKVEGQSLSSSKAFDREETESHAPVMVDPSLLEEHEASFDEAASPSLPSTEDDDDVTDTTGVYEVVDEDIFDDLVPTAVERAQKAGAEERTVIGAVSPGPWFLRSNMGFLLAVALILAVVAGTIYSYIWMKKGEGAGSEQPVVVQLPTKRTNLADSTTNAVPKDSDNKGTDTGAKAAEATGQATPSKDSQTTKALDGKSGDSVAANAQGKKDVPELPKPSLTSKPGDSKAKDTQTPKGTPRYNQRLSRSLSQLRDPLSRPKRNQHQRQFRSPSPSRSSSPL